MPERRAYICDHKDHIQKYPLRKFLLSGDRVPTCPEHEGRKMIPQPNKPYMKGKSKK